MGRSKRRENLARIEQTKKHKELVIFTALLMGAEFYQKYPHQKDYWVSRDGKEAGYSMFDCARKWLWGHNMFVRTDGSIYQVPLTPRSNHDQESDRPQIRQTAEGV
jgi:hypothetical protein